MQLETCSAWLAAALRAGDIIALSGPLGAGKTTFARAVLRALGHQGEVASPTYNLVHPYELDRFLLWHADLYRLDHPGEAEALGLDDHVDAGGVLLVEWPERLGTRIWPEALRLRLEGQGDGPRRLTWEVPAAWNGRWPPR